MNKDVLFQTVSYKWHQCQVSCLFDGIGHFSLKFGRIPCQSSWKNLSLLIDKLQKEVRIFVIDIFDTAFFETTVFFSVIVSVDWFVFECHAAGSSLASVFLLNSPFLLLSP
jgi:hypothetical protein